MDDRSSGLQVRRRRTLQGRVAGLYRTPPGAEGFVTVPVGRLDLGFEGIAGDRHAGLTRKAGGREPWHARGTVMRNERQLSLLSPDELAKIAAGMGIARVDAEWLGGNLLIAGVPHLTLLPPRTLLFFKGGATIRIDGLNQPCRFSGRSVAGHYPDRDGLDFAFVTVAARLRGLVGWVETPGAIDVGETVEVRVPDHWLYPG